MVAARLIIVAVLAVIVGCSSNATKALVGDGLPPPVEPPDDAERYALTGATAKVEVDIQGFVSYTLSFPDVTGELFLAVDTPSDSLANVQVKMRTATTSNDELGRIAKSKDFLDVEKYPEASFEVRGLTDKGSNNYEMIGVLELHGTAKALTVPLTLAWDDCTAVVDTEFTVNRREFGVESDTVLDGMASDDVTIRVRMQVTRKEAPDTCATKSAQRDR